MMRKFNIEVVEKLRCLIAASDSVRISDFIRHYPAIDFAEMVSELEDTEIAGLVRLISDDELASLIRENKEDFDAETYFL